MEFWPPLACCGAMESNLQGPFLLNNTPLAQFSEVKAPMCQYSLQNSFYKLSPPAWAPSCRPDLDASRDILSRPGWSAPTAASCPATPTWPASVAPGLRALPQRPRWELLPRRGASTPPRTRNCWADAGQTGEAGGSAAAVSTGRGEGSGRSGGAGVGGFPWQPLNCLGQTLGLSPPPGAAWGSPSSRPGFAWMGI